MNIIPGNMADDTIISQLEFLRRKVESATQEESDSAVAEYHNDFAAKYIAMDFLRLPPSEANNTICTICVDYVVTFEEVRCLPLNVFMGLFAPAMHLGQLGRAGIITTRPSNTTLAEVSGECQILGFYTRLRYLRGRVRRQSSSTTST